MEDQQPKIGKFSLNYGLILGGLGAAFSLMLFSMDAHVGGDSSVQQIVGIVLMIAITFWGIISFRKANGGLLSIGQGLKLGTGIALVAAIISVIYLYLMANVLDPDFITKTAEASRAALEARGDVPQEMIQQQYQNTIDYFWFAYPFILIINIILGLIIGLVGGLIFKKSEV